MDNERLMADFEKFVRDVKDLASRASVLQSQVSALDSTWAFDMANTLDMAEGCLREQMEEIQCVLNDATEVPDDDDN